MRPTRYLIIVLLGVLLVGMFAASCKKDTGETTYYSTASTTSTLVSSFRLAANSKILSNLDSVHFTIDQERGTIYNADSLPKGTDVTKLTANIVFASTVTRAQFHVTDGQRMQDSTFNYTSSTRDSIDFTGKVMLTLTAGSGQTRSYNIKVNVHQQEPDTLYFAQRARRDLPAVTGTVTAQRMVRIGEDDYFSLLQQGDSYTIHYATSLEQGTWGELTTSLPFKPIVESFTATDDALYILDQSHELMKSENGGASWTDCGVAWYSILGGYGNRVLGLIVDGKNYDFVHDEYPRRSEFESYVADADFPVIASSQLMMATNTWSESQQAMLMGGVKGDGTLSNDVWGYDGETWGKISLGGSWSLPKLAGAVLIPYYTYDVNVKTQAAEKYVTWIVMGGTLSDGTINKTTYTSRDQCLRWVKAGTSMQQPSYMPAFTGAQAFIETITISGSSKAPMRIVKPVTSWECPFIYIVGGTDNAGAVYNNIWKGVINRLMYRPIY